MARTVARSYFEHGNLTRGEFGDIPRPFPVQWLEGEWIKLAWNLSYLDHAEDYTWGVWDSDYGILAPWPSNDVMIDPV